MTGVGVVVVTMGREGAPHSYPRSQLVRPYYTQKERSPQVNAIEVPGTSTIPVLASTPSGESLDCILKFTTCIQCILWSFYFEAYLDSIESLESLNYQI